MLENFIAFRDIVSTISVPHVKEGKRMAMPRTKSICECVCQALEGRFLLSGLSQDITFAHGSSVLGAVVADLSDSGISDDSPAAVALQSNGEIIIAATAGSGVGAAWVIRRYT